MADINSELMGLLARVPYVRCEDVHRQYAVNWLMNNGVTIPVRCKDCAHTRQKTNREQSMYNENVYICTKDDIWGIPKNEPVWGDSFCNDGERRTEGK